MTRNGGPQFGACLILSDLQSQFSAFRYCNIRAKKVSKKLSSQVKEELQDPPGAMLSLEKVDRNGPRCLTMRCKMVTDRHQLFQNDLQSYRYRLKLFQN